jgi:hypothetical protein
MDNVLCIEEIWKPIVGYENLYEVSNLGRIKSLPKKGFKKEVIRKTGMDIRTGYVIVMLRKNNVPKSRRIHSLVIEAFSGIKPSRKLVTNHINGNKRDNRLENLELISQKENVIHALKLGLTKIPIKDERHNSKIKEKDFPKLLELFKTNMTSKDIAQLFKVNPTTISRIRKGKRRPYLFNDDVC